MKVALYPSDDTGCGLSRIIFPAEAARAENVQVDIHHCPPHDPDRPPARMLPLEYHPDNPRLVRPIHVDAQVLVFQRPVEEDLVACLPQLKASGYAIVVEIDDDLERLNPQHPASQWLNPKANPRVNWRHQREAAKMADLVIVSTPALAARYGGHGRVRVLPNCIPERVLSLAHTGDGRTVGWSGWTRTHPGDLRATGGGVQQALDDTGARFLQVGPGDEVQKQLALVDEPEITGPVRNIEDYYRTLTRLDVGICPLADSQFNDAKSYLKILEMAGAGVAVVASPVAEYAKAADEGLCTLAGWRGREWRRQVTRLLESRPMRHDLAGHTREIIAERHTYEGSGWRWAEAWADALQNARSRSLKAAA